MVCLSLLFGTTLPGCGGGGNDTVAARSSPAEAPRSLKTLKAGDTWSYAITYSGNLSNQVTYPGIYSGIAPDAGYSYAQSITTIQRALIGDLPVLAQKTNIRFGDQEATQTQYVTQDTTTGDVSLIADDDAILNSQPVLLLPGAWTPHRTAHSLLDGNESVFTVDKQETVTVPAGTFTAWRVSQWFNNSTYQINGSYWYVPEIGTYVKALYTTVFAQGTGIGSAYTTEIQLTGSNTLPVRN